MKVLLQDAATGCCYKVLLQGHASRNNADNGEVVSGRVCIVVVLEMRGACGLVVKI